MPEDLQVDDTCDPRGQEEEWNVLWVSSRFILSEWR